MSDSLTRRCARCDHTHPVGAFRRLNTGRLLVQCMECESTPLGQDERRNCTACGQRKPLDAYRAIGYQRWDTRCSECQRAAGRARYREQGGREYVRRKHHQRAYGLTPEAYASLLASQGGACAVCEVALASLSEHRVHVDHDHTTGEVRGLLCSRCNTSVVPAVEHISAELLARASAYLLQRSTTHR